MVGANAGSSGLALVAARAFDDEALVRGLVASLELGGFPVVEHGERRYAAGNDLADTVLLYALVQGPLDVSGLITHRIAVDDYREGFEAMRSGNSGKVVMDW